MLKTLQSKTLKIEHPIGKWVNLGQLLLDRHESDPVRLGCPNQASIAALLLEVCRTYESSTYLRIPPCDQSLSEALRSAAAYLLSCLI